MAGQVMENERTALTQEVRRQPDGPGKRIGRRGEITLLAKLTPNGASLFRERVAQFQAEAGYWEKRVGTVHDFRLALFDNDARIIATVTYDGDFKPYLADIAEQAGEWLDFMFLDVIDGYKGIHDLGVGDLIRSMIVEADFFYVSNPELSVRDIAKMARISRAVSDLLDAAS
jgi:hypothetical protein